MGTTQQPLAVDHVMGSRRPGSCQTVEYGKIYIPMTVSNPQSPLCILCPSVANTVKGILTRGFSKNSPLQKLWREKTNMQMSSYKSVRPVHHGRFSSLLRRVILMFPRRTTWDTSQHKWIASYFTPKPTCWPNFRILPH